MKNYQLSITAYDRLGSLERILRVIRHRGGKIITMNMHAIENGQLSLTFNLVDGKVIEQVISQLAKLADIVTINN